MNPGILGVIGPGFLNQVPTLPGLTVQGFGVLRVWLLGFGRVNWVSGPLALGL